MFLYTVRCRFRGDVQSIDHWLAWMRDVHIEEVLECGAKSASVVKMDTDVPTYEIRYQFNSRGEFEIYERDHAPRLRAEGLELFPLDLGLSYERTTGEMLFAFPD